MEKTGKLKRKSLNRRLMAIAITAFLPMLFVLIYALISLSEETKAYSEITRSVTYANQTRDFKERMDYSMYLAVIGNKSFEALGDGETTVNGIVTVDPESYINDMEQKCFELSKIATVEVNKSRVSQLYSTLESLKQNVFTMKEMIAGSGTYEENMEYLDENIYMLTAIIEDVILEYIRVETGNLEAVSANLERYNGQVYRICIVISALAILAAVFLTYRALKSVTGPIKKLCDLTQKVAEGDFTVQAKAENIDEIAILSSSFNEMTKEIGLLVEDIKEKEKNIHLMETQLLQAQINPHFLYNTLDTIVWLAEDNRNEETVSMVTSLSDFFRTTLCQGRDYITVKEEESHIESYLKIQQFRYQDIMDYDIQISEEMYPYVIPKLLLQPLVENALYHGVKQKRGKSTIHVTGVKEGQRLIFKVSDNGKGMSKEKLEHLREHIEKGPDGQKSGSFGLENVNRRIRHYYGNAYGLYIESTENVGTEASIIIEAKNI